MPTIFARMPTRLTSHIIRIFTVFIAIVLIAGVPAAAATPSSHISQPIDQHKLFQMPSSAPATEKIAFYSFRDGNDEIYLMDANGANPTRLTNNTVIDKSPVWSPDGTQMAIMSKRGGDNWGIWVTNADGSNPVLLYTNIAEKYPEGWSPDGQKISFASKQSGNFEIYSINVTGTGLVPLTNDPADDTCGDWAPNGERIVFVSNRGGIKGIYTMKSDGSDPQRLANSTGSPDWCPNWSPDGSKIAYPSNGEIYVINADGSNQVNLTNNPAADFAPDWSPDGAQILFTSSRAGNNEIYVMDANGSNQTRLTFNSANDDGATWQPSATAPETSIPGGTWIEPQNSFNLTGNTLHFSAHAYDNQGGSGVSYVNFTALYAGQWHIACTVTNPNPGTDIYECDWDLSAVPDGSLSVSFDVYDKAGNYNLAPNGTRQGKLTIPPAPIADVAATTDCRGAIVLNWTAPGDNGSVGTAAKYHVRYSTTPITSLGWYSAIEVATDLVPRPQPAGSPEHMVVTGLNPGELYYFAIKAADTSENQPDISNTPSTSAGSATPWTVMLYLDGDNNLDPNYEYLFNYLESAADNPCVNITALWDRAGNTGSTYYKVKQDTNMNQLATYTEGVDKWSKVELSMDKPDTLSEFVGWTRTNYAAQHYALFINDHGTGLNGIARDDTSGAGQQLTIKELGNALSTITTNGANKIDLFFADACFMAMIEDAYQIRNYVDYYIASENYIFITSDPYAKYIKSINLSTMPSDLASTIVHEHAISVSDLPYTISAVDLRRIDSVVTSINDLSSSLKSQMTSYASQITAARAATQKFDARNYNYYLEVQDEYIDLYHFAEEIKTRVPDPTIQNQSQAVIDALTSYVISEKHKTGKWGGSPVPWNLDHSHGVSIFFPDTDFRRIFYAEPNLEFAADANWNQRMALRLPAQVTANWGSMLVTYITQVHPNAPDDPNPPDLIAPLSPIRERYLPLVVRQ